MRPWICAGCVAVVFALIGGCDRDGAKGPAKATIAVIPKGTTHIFWKSIEAGARQAGQEAGVQIVWKGPMKEDDRAQQIGVVDSFVTQGVSAIVLAPLDHTALAAPVANARAKNIPVVIIDSALKGEAGKDFVSFVATDNRKGGSIGGAELVRLLGGKGKIAMLRYMEGSASTMEREAGFLEAIKAGGDVLSVLVDNRYAGATAAEAQSAAMNLADKLRQADGIFCPNESSTYGMLQALRQLGLAGKVKFVGFDTSPPLIEAMQKGEIHGLVAQDPRRMGYLGVQTAIKHLKGEKVDVVIDTGCKLVTAENVRELRD